MRSQGTAKIIRVFRTRYYFLTNTVLTTWNSMDCINVISYPTCSRIQNDTEV